MISLVRLLRIQYVLVKHGVDRTLSEMPLLKSIRLLRLFFPPLWFAKKPKSSGQAIREALEELGPIFIKFGQALSTRRDLIPAEIADELAVLQDNVPSFPGYLAKELIEKTLKRAIQSIFQNFDESPLASASIAQVHSARLNTGEEVIVKVLRPGIRKRIKQDLALLQWIARLAHTQSAFKRFKPIEFVKEFKMTLLDELDLLREAANASQLRRNVQHSPILYIPEVYWDYTRPQMLVLERIHGVRISDIATLKAKQIDFNVLGERLIEIFFTQVFHDCFFHADMHPGNLFVDCTEPHSPRFIAVDFGIMGSLSREDQHYLAENFLAFFKRDYRRVAELHVESGWVPPDVRIDAFEASIRTVCEPIFERPLKDISFAQTLLSLFQTARRFNVEIQPQFLLLQKTLMNVEGLGRQLSPDLDIWHTAKPILESWVKKQVGLSSLVTQLKVKLPRWIERMPEMPEAIYQVVNRLKHSTQLQNHHERQQQMSRTSKLSLVKALMGCFCLTAGGGLLFWLKPQWLIEYGTPLSLGLIATGLLILMFSWFQSVVRPPR